MVKALPHKNSTAISRRDVLMGGATITFAISAPGYSRLARAQPTRYVRRNIYDLARQNDPVIASYARAVDAMMKLPVDDPTSWWFQANMHDYPNSGGEGPLDEFTAPSKTDFFNKCPHGNFHFLPWHRLYLYYFERIVRKVSGNLNFALPFWNYERPGESTLPVPFRWRDDPMLPEPIPVLERPNPLARANRHSLINEGLFGMGDTASSSVAALAMANFLPVGGGTSFGGDGTGMLKQPVQSGELEGQPHDVVHGMIGIAGGDMASTRTAARDPIFWLHHAQIDRLWVEWVNRGDGRSNPVNNEDWMHTQFTFFDEDGNQVTKTAADALDTQLDFGYRYDTDPHRDEALVVAAQERHSDSALRSGPPTVELTEKAKSIKLGGRQATVNIPLSSTGRANLETARTSSAASQTRYFLVLENIKIDRMFSSYYEIYLNKPAEAAADPSGPYFVGTLAFFGMTHSHSDEGAKRVYDVTTIVETSLPGAGAMKNEINLTFVQRGPVGPAGEFLVDETVRPEIGSIRLLQR